MNINVEFDGLLEKLLAKPPAFEGVPEVSGVYQIVNLINKKVLLGSSNNMREALQKEKFLLENGAHPNKKLQADVKTYGIRAFEFSVLEETENLDEVKRNYFKTLSCYNKFIRKPKEKHSILPATFSDFQKLFKQN